MSTAILHAGSFIHDFNDIVMKVCWLELRYFPLRIPLSGNRTLDSQSRMSRGGKSMETRIRKAHVLLP